MPDIVPDPVLRDATPDDRAYLERLNERSYRAVVERQFGAWDRAAQAASFARKWERGTYQIVLWGDAAAGALLLERRDDHFFLADIQIEAAAQGKGLGTRVLDVVMKRAASAGLPLRLRVLHLNRARALYERLGFRPYGTTETHYLMEKVPDPA